MSLLYWYSFHLQMLTDSSRRKLTCSPKTDPATMGVQPLQRSRKRTLYGQTTLPGADRPQAPGCGGEAGWRGNSPGGCQRTRHQRGYVPPLEESVRWDEFQRGLRRLKELENENARLKKLVAEQALQPSTSSRK